MKKRISGIYAIKVENRILYIGSSLNIYHRGERHIFELNKRIHFNPHLIACGHKYDGKNSFTGEILEECEPNDKILTERETYGGKILKPECNIAIPERNVPPEHKKVKIGLYNLGYDLIKEFDSQTDCEKYLNAGISMYINKYYYKPYKKQGYILREPINEEIKKLLKPPRYKKIKIKKSRIRKKRKWEIEREKFLESDGVKIHPFKNYPEIYCYVNPKTKEIMSYKYKRLKLLKRMDINMNGIEREISINTLYRLAKIPIIINISKPVEVFYYNKDGQLIEKFKSIGECRRKLKMNDGAIRKRLNSKHPEKCKYILRRTQGTQ